MSVGTNTLASDPQQSASELLQNIPAPLADPSSTVTLDVEHNRFYAYLPAGQACGELRHGDAVRQLWETAYTWYASLEQLSLTPLDLSEYDFAPTTRLHRRVSQMLRNWLGPPSREEWFPVTYILLDRAIGRDVLRFCEQADVLEYLPVALQLVEQCFVSVRSLDVTLENDPDTGEEWASVNAQVAGDSEEILAGYDEYTDRWLSAVPFRDTDKIRLFYYLE